MVGQAARAAEPMAFLGGEHSGSSRSKRLFKRDVQGSAQFVVLNVDLARNQLENPEPIFYFSINHCQKIEILVCKRMLQPNFHSESLTKKQKSFTGMNLLFEKCQFLMIIPKSTIGPKAV
ncbi:hypothetical protein ACG74X_16065 [Marivita sp. S0852]|uniref:hypothetical protein n=1 Tax=Marivita sp. S0852 TaxID=3373893 RepID=UPI003982260F